MTSPEETQIAAATSIAPGADAGGTAVLLVNHGSHSPGWRRMLLDVHAEVAAEVLELPGVGQVRTAFMEYSEPSIASQLRACDASGVEDVLVVPLLLTISDHSFDDIPTICGVAADPDRVAQLAEEKIEVHRPRAEVRFAPLLDFSDLVKANLARRIRAIVGRREAEAAPRDGLVLVGYGSAEFEDEWNRFFSETRLFAESELGIAASAHAWCGHIVRYRRQPIVDAIDAVLERAERVIVVPLLVAYDPMFQDRIIGRAVDRCAAPERVLYRRDAILPEPAVGRWVVDACRRLTASRARSEVPG